MSSLVRRIQKNIAKGQGFYRSTDTKGGRTVKVIRNSDNATVGTRWPQVSYPTRRVKEK